MWGQSHGQVSGRGLEHLRLPRPRLLNLFENFFSALDMALQKLLVSTKLLYDKLTGFKPIAKTCG